MKFRSHKYDLSGKDQMDCWGLFLSGVENV